MSAYRMQTGVGNVRATTTVKSGYSVDEAEISTLSFSNKYLHEMVFARDDPRRRTSLCSFCICGGNHIARERTLVLINDYSSDFRWNVIKFFEELNFDFRCL